MALAFNGKVCNELVLNTSTFENLVAHFMGFMLGTLDPNNTLWVQHFETAGGAEDPGFRTFIILLMEDPSPINTMNAMTQSGENQAMTWCKDIYDANGIADLAGQDGNVCCQYYYVNEDPEEDY